MKLYLLLTIFLITCTGICADNEIKARGFRGQIDREIKIAQHSSDFSGTHSFSNQYYNDDYLPYTVVDTAQNYCYNAGSQCSFPSKNDDFYGQDAQYNGNTPRYKDNGDGTITDLNTGLMWQKTPDFIKRDHYTAIKYGENLTLAGYSDWRVPTIKELFSIAEFNGNMHTKTPYINTKVFDFKYPVASPNAGPGNRDMDVQYSSSTLYTGLTMADNESSFGFNFADGRIKSYPLTLKKYVRCCRGAAYGVNKFRDNGDGTITDENTGLIWQKADSRKTMNWKDALSYAENLNYAGHDDWRLPNVKELQSIVDYTRAPDSRTGTVGAAIDPIFDLTETESWFWTSTTHVENQFGYYVAFGQALSAKYYNGKQMNAHGAGAVRSDPKSGDPSKWPNGLGPQYDEIRIYNYVRCVRGGNTTLADTSSQPPAQGSPGGSPEWQRFAGRLDKNSDGKISASEFDGPARHFKFLDKNKDGYITESEMPKDMPKPRKQNY